MDGFDHAKGDIPFFMYDKINVTGEVLKEDDEKKQLTLLKKAKKKSMRTIPKCLNCLKNKKRIL